MVHPRDSYGAAARRVHGAASPRPDDPRYAFLPHYLLGLVGTGGEAHMLAAYKPGWIVVSVQVNPPDSTGNFSSLSNRGLSPIVILNHASEEGGSLPYSMHYDLFAGHCADFVRQSRGARVWVIGDEPNAARSRPAHDEVITPEMYARCFIQCRRAIRAVPGHEHDWVIPAAIAPFNTETSYSGNRTGDWVRYFADSLLQISLQEGKADALALHVYTHGGSAALVSSNVQAPRQSGRHWHFRVMRDYLAAVTPANRQLPVLITSASPADPGWSQGEEGWIQAACSEVHEWNSQPGNQTIQALCFRRWHARPHDPPGIGMADKPSVVDDFRKALENDYRVRWPGNEPAPDYCVQWISGLHFNARALSPSVILAGTIVARNAGALAWQAEGAHALELRARWLDRRGQVLPDAWVEQVAPMPLPADVLPGQTLWMENVEVRAPRVGGDFVCRFDLVRLGGAALEQLGSPTLDQQIIIEAPPYAAEWGGMPEMRRQELTRDTEWTGAVTVRNLGASTWPKDGPLCVTLRYGWRDAEGDTLHLEAALDQFTLDADAFAGDLAVFDGVVLRAPHEEGEYTVHWELYEGRTPLSERGIEPFVQTLKVVPPIPPFAAAWAFNRGLPDSLEPNQTVSLDFSVTNTGRDSWLAGEENGVRLTWKWLGPDGQPVEGPLYCGERNLADGVSPGEAWRVQDLRLRAPVPQGKYRISLDLFMPDEGTLSEVGGQALALDVPIQTDAPPERVEWLARPQLARPALAAGGAISGTLSFKNTGAQTLSATDRGGRRVCFRWLDVSGRPVASGSFPLEDDVLPSETDSVDIALTVPSEPGRYSLVYFVGVEAATELSPLLASPPEPALVRLPPVDLEAEYIEHDLPANVPAGARFQARVKVRNIGLKPWPAEGDAAVLLQARWLENGSEAAAGPPVLSPLQQGVAREEEYTFDLDLTAPDSAGIYRLALDLFESDTDPSAGPGRTRLLARTRVTGEPVPGNLWRAASSHNPAQAVSAIDGDPATSWSSLEPQAEEMWFQIDLGAPRVTDAISLRSPGLGYPSGFTLSISIDGENWREVTAIGQGNARDVFAPFAPAELRFFRVTLTAPSREPWRISEVQVHESPVWQATASVNGEWASLAIDNDVATCWTTGDLSQRENMWFQVDLGAPTWVSGVTLAGPPGQAAAELQVSGWREPEGGWLKIGEAKGETGLHGIEFAPVLTRYLHFRAKSSAEQPWSISQVTIDRELTGWISNW